MVLIKNTWEWMAKVGPLKYWARMISRQFVKRVRRRDLRLKLPNDQIVILPASSAFSSVAWVTGGEVDDGFEVLLRMLGEQGTAFFDVGAHFGFYCSFLGDRHMPVVAFEPDARTLPALRRNLEPIPHSKCIAAAVSDRCGVIQFASDVSSPQSRILSEGEEALNKSVTTVPVTTIDQVWQDLLRPRVGVMKIDTEGHEELVIQGARSMIAACRPLLLVEASSKSMAPHVAWLESLGYCALTLSKRHCAQTQTVQVFPTLDISGNFEEGMILFVSDHGRASKSWADVVAGRCNLTLSAGNWNSR